MIDFTELWTGLDWAVVAIYFIGILFVGVSMRKRAGKDVQSYFVAARRLTVPVLIGVAAAGWYDSWSIVGVAECGYTMGLVIFLVFIVPESILRLPLALIVGPHVRDEIPDWVVTVPDMMAYLYDDKVKLVSAITYMVSVLYDSALLFAIAEVLMLVSGVPILASLAITTAVIIIYTALSGLWGLAVTDLIQFAIMTVSAGALMLGIIQVYGGLPVVWEIVETINPNLLKITGEIDIWESLAWIVAACAMYSEAQCYQRFSAAESGASIKSAFTLMLSIGMVFSAVMVFSGLAALAFFGDVVSSPAEGFWALVFSVLPVGMRGLFVAALCAAVMSTVSADWLIYSACAVNDITKGFIKKDMTQAQTVTGMRIAVAVFGILCAAGTVLWADGIANAWYYLGGFAFAMFFIPITAGLFYKKKTPQGGLSCIVYSAFAYVFWEFIFDCPGDVPSSVFVTITGAAVYFIVSAITYDKNKQINETM